MLQETPVPAAEKEKKLHRSRDEPEGSPPPAEQKNLKPVFEHLEGVSCSAPSWHQDYRQLPPAEIGEGLLPETTDIQPKHRAAFRSEAQRFPKKAEMYLDTAATKSFVSSSNSPAGRQILLEIGMERQAPIPPNLRVPPAVGL